MLLQPERRRPQLRRGRDALVIHLSLAIKMERNLSGTIDNHADHPVLACLGVHLGLSLAMAAVVVL